jgi:PAS domain S-box-containing protein
MTDITEKRKTEEALRESEEKFRRMAEVSPEIFWMATLDWSRTIYVSPAFERITGITLDEAYRDPRVFLEIVHQDDMSLVKSVIETIQEQDMEFEFRIIRKDGSMRWISFRSSLIIDEQGNPLYLTGIAEDITERKLSEEERNTYEARLMRSQKLEAIGTLAGGIAHDFNNILSAIIGYSELSLDDLPQDSTVRDSIHEILKAGDRARDLVKQILTFSRKMETEYRPIRIQVIAREALKLLRSSIPSTISITEHIDPDASPVLADASQIHQIIMNLCTNAYHAMLPAGGEMTISLEQLFLDSEFTALHPGLHEGIYLRLVVSDTGCGMDAETLKRIFDPFFTTKEKGQGTGLGLSTVHGIVSSLGGAVVATSTIAGGSTFEVYIPVIQAQEEDTEEPDYDLVQGSGESILLVDDEEAILQFAKAMLEQLGYRVTPVSSSIEALKIFSSAPDSFDLVVTDQTMPGMTGSTLATEVMKTRPLPVILMTGYSETITPEEALAKGIEEYLEKPFTRQAIVRAIQRCLQERKGP